MTLVTVGFGGQITLDADWGGIRYRVLFGGDRSLSTEGNCNVCNRIRQTSELPSKAPFWTLEGQIPLWFIQIPLWFIGIVQLLVIAKMRCSRSGGENSWRVTRSSRSSEKPRFGRSLALLEISAYLRRLPLLRMNLDWLAFTACL
jgi:hypothetical protein